MSNKSSFWDAHQHTITLENFRDEPCYLGNQIGFPYRKVVEFIRTLKKPWLDLLKEDDAFKCPIDNIDGVVVSRDLLDSILEIEFLERCGFSLNEIQILDIGAGYGRLAHRLLTVYPNAFVYCTDKIQISQEVCRKYLQFREISRAEVVAPADLSKIENPTLAINIHSWPECTHAEIIEWLDWLANHNVPHIFVIPHPFNSPPFACLEDNKSFRPDIEAHGYQISHHWKPVECFPRDFYLFSKIT